MSKHSSLREKDLPEEPSSLYEDQKNSVIGKGVSGVK